MLDADEEDENEGLDWIKVKSFFYVLYFGEDVLALDEDFARLMGEATKYIGWPYVWGGSSPATSFDCSGFVCWVYTHSGVYDLPRTTAQSIYNQCVPVSRDELKPGDLVFFTGTYATTNAVSHIGIFVGDNQMIHAGDPIGYANLGNSYWIKHLYGYVTYPELIQILTQLGVLCIMLITLFINKDK